MIDLAPLGARPRPPPPSSSSSLPTPTPTPTLPTSPTPPLPPPPPPPRPTTAHTAAAPPPATHNTTTDPSADPFYRLDFDDSALYGEPFPSTLHNLVELREAEARAARARAADRTAAVPRRGQKLKRNLLIACILMGFFFSLLDTTIVSTSLLATSEDLDGFRDSSWVVISYLLTYMGFSIFFAKLSDIYGRRNILIVSWIIFVISSVACGCAYDMTQLIVCRSFQGIGGAGLYSLTTICLPEIGPADKPDVIGKIIGVTLSLSFVLGPVLGGFIPQIASWRVIYWLNAPFAIVAIVGIVFLYPVEHSRCHGTNRTLRRVDLVGSLLLLGSTVLLVIAMQEAGSLVVAWNSLLVLTSLTAAAICFALFMGWETLLASGRYWEIEPVFPLRLLRNRVYLSCLLDKFLVGYVYLCLVITVPQRFQIVNSQSVFKTGLHLLPMLGGTAFGCLVTGPLNAKKNHTSPVVVVACALMLVSVALLATVDSVAYRAPPLYVFLTLFGVGFGLFMSAGTMLSTAQAQLDDHAAAQGAISQLRILGGVIGLSTFTIVFNHKVAAGHVLAALTPPQRDVLRRSPTALVEVWPELQPLVAGTYSAAFHEMTCILAGLAALALLVSLGTYEKNPPPIHRNFCPEKEYLTRQSSEDIEMDDAASGRSLVAYRAAARSAARSADRPAAAAATSMPMPTAPVPTLYPPPRSLQTTTGPRRPRPRPRVRPRQWEAPQSVPGV